MTLAMLLRTIFEILLFTVVIFCIFHEDKLAALEKRFFCYLKRRRLKVMPHANLIRNSECEMRN